MKKILYIISIITLLSCNNVQYKYKYELTYIDGTKEIKTFSEGITWDMNRAGCIYVYDIGMSACGVREFKLLSKTK